MHESTKKIMLKYLSFFVRTTTSGMNGMLPVGWQKNYTLIFHNAFSLSLCFQLIVRFPRNKVFSFSFSETDQQTFLMKTA